WKGWAISHRQKQKKLIMLPSETMIWQPEFTDKTLSRKPGAVQIERHNLNLRQHLARLGRKSLSFSKSVELHDKVIGHYLNIKHY
ncbi:IS1 family transposase, partial [Escherichia coli]|nr:IS1 family transposase [Escherichia coli]